MVLSLLSQNNMEFTFGANRVYARCLRTLHRGFTFTYDLKSKPRKRARKPT